MSNYARVRWLIISMLFVASGISYLDRAALSVAAPLVAKDLHLNPAQLGLVFSIFFFGYATFCFVGGYSSDKIGPKNVFTLAMTVWSLFCGLTAAATGMASLLIIRLIFGAGEGPFASTANKFVRNWIPRHEHAKAVCMSSAGNPIGAAVAGPVVGFIAVTWGWRWSFIIIAAMGLVWVMGWVYVMADRPDQHRWLRVEAARGDFADLKTGVQATPRLPLRAYLLRTDILADAFSMFAFTYIIYFFLTWFPSYLVMAQHLSIQKMSVVSMIPWLVGFFGGVGSGFLIDEIYRRTGRALFSRKVVLVGSLLVASVCIALAGIVTSIVSVVTLIAVAVFATYLMNGAFWAIILDIVEAPRIGGVGGFVHLIANTAGLIAPSVTGLIVQVTGSFMSAFVLTGAIALTAALSAQIFIRLPEQEVSRIRMRPAE